jgi:hypothetical protein
MKSIKTLWALFFALGLVFTSCSDDDANDDSTNPVVEPLVNEISVDIDGVNWRGTIGSFTKDIVSTELSASKAGSNIQVKIFIPTDSVNSFNIPISLATVAVKRNNSTLSDSPTGTMLLSSNDSISISGTFNCSVTSFSSNDTLVLTNGAFEYSY